MPRKRTAPFCAALLLLAAPLLAGTAARADDPARHGSAGCAAFRGPNDARAQAVVDAVEKVRSDLKLRAVEVSVTQNGRDVWTGAFGPSMTDVPAEPAMRFRAGSVGIAFMNV